MLSIVQVYKLLENQSENELPSSIPPLLMHGKTIQEQDFWKSFIQLCKNNEGMSELLGVPKDQISLWPHKIQNALDKLNTSANNNSFEHKNKMIDTGN